MTRPFLASTSRRPGRTRNVTSAPLCCSRPPIYPPIAPAPRIKVFTSGPLQSIPRAPRFIGLQMGIGEAQVGRGDAVLARPRQHVAHDLLALDGAALLDVA